MEEINATKILSYMPDIVRRTAIAEAETSGYHYYRNNKAIAWDEALKVADRLRLVKRDGLGMNPLTSFETITESPMKLVGWMERPSTILCADLEIGYPLSMKDTPLVVGIREHTLFIEYTTDHRAPLTLLDWVDLLEKVIDQTYGTNKPYRYEYTEDDDSFPVYRKRSQVCQVHAVYHMDGKATVFRANADHLRSSIIPHYHNMEVYPVFIEILDDSVYLHMVGIQNNLGDLLSHLVNEPKDD